MNIVELRHLISEHLSHIDDISFLNALKTIVESKAGKTYQLSDYQKERINTARKELRNKQSISHKDLQKEIDQWLDTK